MHKAKKHCMVGSIQIKAITFMVNDVHSSKSYREMGPVRLVKFGILIKLYLLIQYVI